ncbi:MAG: Smr/MutS family protein, partial [Flavobacteriales bacterium]
DMLRMQLQAFKRKMEEAQRKRVQKLIVIHGVGEGVLRSEIRTALRQYENIEVLDADYTKYGRGATEVRFFGV